MAAEKKIGGWLSAGEIVEFPSGSVGRLRTKPRVQALVANGVLSEEMRAFTEDLGGREKIETEEDAERLFALRDIFVKEMFLEPKVVSDDELTEEQQLLDDEELYEEAGKIRIISLTEEDANEAFNRAMEALADAASFRGEGENERTGAARGAGSKNVRQPAKRATRSK